MLAALVYPRIQGADLCGHIIEVGRNVKRTRIGKPVPSSALMQDPKNSSRFQCWTMGSECDADLRNIIAHSLVRFIPLRTAGAI